MDSSVENFIGILFQRRFAQIIILILIVNNFNVKFHFLWSASRIQWFIFQPEKVVLQLGHSKIFHWAFSTGYFSTLKKTNLKKKIVLYFELIYHHSQVYLGPCQICKKKLQSDAPHGPKYPSAVTQCKIHDGSFKNYVTQSFWSLIYCNPLTRTRTCAYQGVTEY